MNECSTFFGLRCCHNKTIFHFSPFIDSKKIIFWQSVLFWAISVLSSKKFEPSFNFFFVDDDDDDDKKIVTIFFLPTSNERNKKRENFQALQTKNENESGGDIKLKIYAKTISKVISSTTKMTTTSETSTTTTTTSGTTSTTSTTTIATTSSHEIFL